jgi:hypothetical protein
MDDPCEDVCPLTLPLRTAHGEERPNDGQENMLQNPDMISVRHSEIIPSQTQGAHVAGSRQARCINLMTFVTG